MVYEPEAGDRLLSAINPSLNDRMLEIYSEIFMQIGGDLVQLAGRTEPRVVIYIRAEAKELRIDCLESGKEFWREDWTGDVGVAEEFADGSGLHAAIGLVRLAENGGQSPWLNPPVLFPANWGTQPE